MRLAYMQGTALHFPLAMMLNLQDLLAGNCSQVALGLMREPFLGNPRANKMTAWWITNWSQRRRPPPPSTNAAMEKWMNDLATEMHDGHHPFCCMHTIKEDGSCFVTGFTAPNLIRNALTGRGEDYLSIVGQSWITVEDFTMQIVGTCDRVHHLLLFAVCVATAERKEVEKVGMLGAPTKGMADHADRGRIAGATQPAPFPSPTAQETPAKVPPPPQQEKQGAFVPIKEGNVEVFQNHPVVKVGWRAYLVPQNYGGNLDCDQATCIQLEKRRGGTEEVTCCVDTQNTDMGQRVNGDRLTYIVLLVFGKWMTEADIAEVSR